MNDLRLEDCLNERCPWSGDPVQANSLTRYRGQVVGFCNPGCRDKFDRAVALFEGGLRGDRYLPRSVYSVGDWRIGSQRLKAYGMSQAGQQPLESSCVEAACAYVERDLPVAVEREGGAEGPGFCIIHAGGLGTWLLVHWWAHEDICCQRIALAEPGSERFRSVDERSLHACVWEQVVINHERNAWVRHAMAAEPRHEHYIADRLPDGMY